MLKKIGSNQHRNRWEYGGLKLETWYSIFTVLGLMFFLLWLMKMNEPEFISPISDSPLIRKVCAEDYTKETPKQIIRRVAGRHSATLLAISQCESGLRSGAVGPTSDYGLFQVHIPSHRNRIPGKTDYDKIMWLQNPENNVWFSYSLYLEQGLAPWYSSKNCWEGKI